jgi:hypothetical protein
VKRYDFPSDFSFRLVADAESFGNWKENSIVNCTIRCFRHIRSKLRSTESETYNIGKINDSDA